MSYQIQYPIVSRLERKCAGRKGLPNILVAIAICVIILTVTVYVVGVQTVVEYMIPGNNEITVSAFCEMQDNLSDGMSAKDAITAFCTEIIESAGLQ